MAALGSVQQPFNPYLHEGYAGGQPSQGYPLQQYSSSGSDTSSSSSSEEGPASTVRRVYPERAYRPAAQLIPLSARPAFTLESQVDRLIERAFIPLGAKMEVTDQGRYFMATNMEELKDLILECFPAAPSVPKNKMKFQSPRYPGDSLKIQSLFKKLLRAAIPVKEGRKFEAFHIIFGFEIKKYMVKDVKSKAKGSDVAMESSAFACLLLEVGKKRHQMLLPKLPPCETVMGEAYNMLRRAVEAGKYSAEDDATAKIYDDQRIYAESAEYVRQNAARTNANIAATGRAIARATAIAPPPVTSMIVANPYWTPSNDASYVTMRAPNGVYY